MMGTYLAFFHSRAKADKIPLALWAADCAQHVLHYFEDKYPNDKRPRKAIKAARAWARGKMPFKKVRLAALAAHAAARRAVKYPKACAAARAAGHAAAIAHSARHAMGVPYYVDKMFTGARADRERTWQLRRLPGRFHVLLKGR